MEKEKQLKEFNFHGLKLIGVYNPKLDSWWFRGKEVYKCLGVSKSAFSKYMKQVDDKHKTKLNNTKIDKIFKVSKLETMKNVSNRYETLISEAGLYRLATCIGKTKVWMYWTQKGRLFIYDTLKAQGILPLVEQYD